MFREGRDLKKSKGQLKRIIIVLCVLFVSFLAVRNYLIKTRKDLAVKTIKANKYGHSIFYHCADWGPVPEEEKDSKWDEKIYFVKQIIFYERDEIIGNDVYFCSMNPDGSDKREITKLFENTNYPLSTDGLNSNMDICWKTKQAAIAFAAGGIEQTGLWIINLDGTEFKRIVKQDRGKEFKLRVNYPSWFPDGEHLVYHEKLVKRGELSEYYIVKVNKEGKDKKYLTTEKDAGKYNLFPVVSHNGVMVAYTHMFNARETDRNIWIMNKDGSNKRILYDNSMHYADYPEWSPDGSKIYIVEHSNFNLIESNTGKELMSKFIEFDKEKYIIPRKMHWSDKYGYLFDTMERIRILKFDLSGYSLELIGGYVETDMSRDLSKDWYRWGKVL